jgi:hypothetical protein
VLCCLRCCLPRGTHTRGGTAPLQSSATGATEQRTVHLLGVPRVHPYGSKDIVSAKFLLRILLYNSPVSEAKQYLKSCCTEWGTGGAAGPPGPAACRTSLRAKLVELEHACRVVQVRMRVMQSSHRPLTLHASSWGPRGR